MIALCECVWECLDVTFRAVACLRGGSFLATFLVLSKHIVWEWLPVTASLELCLFPDHAAAVAFPLLSHSLSSFLAPFRLPLYLLLHKYFHPARKVTQRSWYWWFCWSLYFICGVVFFFSLKTFNHNKTTNIGFIEFLPHMQQPGPEVALMMTGLQLLPTWAVHTHWRTYTRVLFHCCIFNRCFCTRFIVWLGFSS